MKVKYYIPRPDDSGELYETSFLMRVTGVQHKLGRRTNHLGEKVVQSSKLSIASRESKKLDPANEMLATSVRNYLIPKAPSTKYRYIDVTPWDRWTAIITFKRDDGDAMLWIQKNNSVYTLNSQRMNLEDISRAIAKVIFKSCFDRSAESLENYIDTVVTYPANVLYALENRTPYQFWDDGTKIDVRINTSLIGEKTAVLEISEGIWGEISVSDLNTFINTFGLHLSRSKTWYRITPKKLWTRLMGEEPTESQLKLMIAWLMQNRTQDMVETRAKELLQDLSSEYDNIELVLHEGYMALFVRGKDADWIIADAERGMKQNHQKVNTYFWSGKDWSGPICIDNLHVNSSIGDQLAARAMMLLNDRQAGDMIYTLRSLEPLSAKWDGKHRFDRTLLKPYSGVKDKKKVAKTYPYPPTVAERYRRDFYREQPYEVNPNQPDPRDDPQEGALYR